MGSHLVSSRPYTYPRAVGAKSTSSKIEHEPWFKHLVKKAARRFKSNPLLFTAMVRSFRVLQRLGINVTPNHFYWPVPDIRELANRDWAIYPMPPGCNLRLSEQIRLARLFAERYVPELEWSNEPAAHSYHYQNGYFESCDAEVAYAMVRHWKPQRIIEIGSGYSSRIIGQALHANRTRDGVLGELTTIDPHPERLPRNDGWPSVTVVPRRVQDLDLGLFRSLGANDILFIDSSHVVSIGSDVVCEYLQILPQLNPGVVVHVHDVFLPSDYPRPAVLDKLCFWSEQYLLQAFLAYNREFEVLWSASAMEFSHSDVLELCFPNWRNSYIHMPPSTRQFIPSRDGKRVWPASFWMRRSPH
ncbi:MAG TPA: class I SAM-dependent methyltransferase [Terriglobales bacterium]|nr:class I SAM-dependent methyltransferase [Terriglobales bacterium]